LRPKRHFIRFPLSILSIPCWIRGIGELSSDYIPSTISFSFPVGSQELVSARGMKIRLPPSRPRNSAFPLPPFFAMIPFIFRKKEWPQNFLSVHVNFLAQGLFPPPLQFLPPFTPSQYGPPDTDLTRFFHLHSRYICFFFDLSPCALFLITLYWRKCSTL